MNNEDQPLLNKKAERYGKAIAGFVAARGSAAALDVRKIIQEEQSRPSHCGRKMIGCTDGNGNVIYFKCFLCGIRYAPEKQPNAELSQRRAECNNET